MFETDITNLAAYLIYKEHELDGLEFRKGVCTFFFRETDELLDDMETYIRNDGEVEPNQFARVLGGLKRQMWEERDRLETTTV